MRTLHLPSGRCPRALATLAFYLASLLATGCSAAMPPSASAAPPSPPPPSMAADGPPPAPAAASGSGYAPPSAPSERGAPTGPAPVAPGNAAGPRGAPSKGPPATTPRPTDKASATAASATAPAVAPLLIYTGDLSVQVEDGEVALTLDKVVELAESLGGYLAGRKDTSVQVRVPSARFRDAFSHLEKLGEVMHLSVTADDVSEQYSDLEVRLTNLRATRQRLQELLARAGGIPDVLQVERELERVAAEIEQIEGKMRFLRSRAAFSLLTVNVAVRPRTVAKVVETTPPPVQVDLPIDWLSRIGLGRLLNLRDR